MTWAKSWNMEDWSFEDLSYRPLPDPDPDSWDEDEQVTLIKRRT